MIPVAMVIPVATTTGIVVLEFGNAALQPIKLTIQPFPLAVIKMAVRAGAVVIFPHTTEFTFQAMCFVSGQRAGSNALFNAFLRPVYSLTDAGGHGRGSANEQQEKQNECLFHD
jgi:hypothetical protein